MKIKGKQEIEIEVTPRQIGYALAQIAMKICRAEGFDDGGCDWFTTDSGDVIIGMNSEWKMCTNRKDVVALVDAMNVMFYGKVLKFYDKE